MLSGLVVLVTLAAPALAHAQQPDQSGSAAGWAPASLGVRLGFDQAARGEVIGAQLRVPVLPSGRVELMPSGDVTFLTGLRDYGFNLDAVYVSGGRRGGIYLGGGLALRNSLFTSEPDADRETKTAFGAVIGVKGGGPGRLGTQVEFRWIFLPDDDYDPRTISLGVNFPLWR